MNASFWAAFYGSSLAWYSPITALLGLLIMFSNATLLWLATTTSRIRVVGCNWIVINLAISDYSFGLVHVLSLVPYWICYEGSSACAALTVVCAALKTVAVSSASLFSLLIAVHRYVKITQATSPTLWRRRMGSNSTIVAVIIIIWGFVLASSMGLWLGGLFGANGDGFYGFRWSTFSSKSFFINTLVYALCTVMCRTGTSLIYWRLHRYMVRYESAAARAQFRRRSQSEPMYGSLGSEKQPGDRSATMGIMKMISLATMIPAAGGRRSSSINVAQMIDSSDRLDTRTLIRLIKQATFIPLATESFTLLIKISLALSSYDMYPSIAVLRLFSLLLFVPPICNPILSVTILRPFRQEFEKRVLPAFLRFSLNKVSVE